MNDLSYNITIDAQPTETTCGPTCLHSIYSFLGKQISLQKVIDEIQYTSNGGTLGVLLAKDAQSKGLESIIYTHNLTVFDPSWFKINNTELINKLKLQANSNKEQKIKEASSFYAEFLENGGKILFESLTPEFLYRIIKKHGPVICGLSATYLYMCERELEENCQYDDVNGSPQGHFVVLKGIEGDCQKVTLADPMATNPLAYSSEYTVDTHHFINSLLVGVITYDANIITFQKAKGSK